VKSEDLAEVDAYSAGEGCGLHDGATLVMNGGVTVC